MPKKLERKLAATARKRHYGKKRRSRYIYGTLNKLGLLHRRKKH